MLVSTVGLPSHRLASLVQLKICIQDALSQIPAPHEAPMLPYLPTTKIGPPPDASLQSHGMQPSRSTSKGQIGATVSFGKSTLDLVPLGIHTSESSYARGASISSPEDYKLKVDSKAGESQECGTRTLSAAGIDQQVSKKSFTVRTSSQVCDTPFESQNGNSALESGHQCGMHALPQRNTVSEEAIQRLNEQLNSFKPKHRFLGKFEMLGRSSRRHGGVNPTVNSGRVLG